MTAIAGAPSMAKTQVVLKRSSIIYAQTRLSYTPNYRVRAS
jgi:hypothetical protein